MQHPPRPYQSRAVERALDHARRASEDAAAPRRLLLTAPTGTGKRLIMQATQRAILDATGCSPADCRILVPGPEIARSFCSVDAANDTDLMELAWTEGVTTPLRLVNAILKGEASASAMYLIDEAHHSTASTHETLRVLSHPETIWIGYTGTGYRGTPKGTADLHTLWGKPEPILSIFAAVRDGWMALPTFRTVPLVNDDLIEVEAGEFVVKRVERAVTDRLHDIARVIAEIGLERPTMVACPSRAVAYDLERALADAECPSVVIDGDSDREWREDAYRSCQRREAVLLQIAVVGEGVDLPWLRRLIDCRPTMSPVAWLQLVGRITRATEPGEAQPEYIGLCRNLARHAYLWEEYTPLAAVLEEQNAFGGPSVRQSVRHVGIEGASRFKRLPLRLASGLRAEVLYVEQYSPETGSEQYCIICTPTKVDPIVARRKNLPGQYARWQRADLPADLMGFATSGMRGPASDKQKAAWARMAKHHGLDPVLPEKAAMRDISPLFVLKDLGVRL